MAINSGKSPALLLFLLLSLLSFKSYATVSERVLDEIRTGHYNGKPVIQLRLERELQYVSHLELDQGKKFEIALQAISGVKENRLYAEPPEHEYLQWTPDQSIPLWQVEYREENHEHHIILYFTRQVHIQIKSASNYKALIITLVDKAEAQLEKIIKKSSKKFPPLTAEQQKLIEQAMNAAKKAIRSGNYAEAAGYLEKVLILPVNAYQQAALELKGVTWEKRGQFRQAIRIYQKYLQRYPKGESSQRVRQRLNSLQSAGQQPQQLREAKTRPQEQWKSYGSLEQYFRYDQSYNGGSSLQINRRALDTLVYYGSNYRSKEMKIKTRFSGNYNYDTASTKGSFSSISNLYGKIISKKWGLTSIVGRQTRNKGGVFGRMDGVYLNKPLNKQQSATLTLGYPVATTKAGVQSDKSLLSLGYQWKNILQSWQFSTYFIRQNNTIGTDRQAIGGEFSYNHDKRFIYGMVDYDVLFSSLNLLSVSGNMHLDKTLSWNFSLDQRNSPWLYLSSASAIVNNQPINQLDELNRLYSQSQLVEMVKDKSAVLQTFLLGLDKKLNQRLQINSSLTLTRQGASKASYGNQAIAATGIDQFYDIHLTINGLFQQQDISLAGLRLSNTDNSNSLSLSFSSRFPYDRHWRFNPRVNIDYRSYKNNSLVSSEWRLFPGFEARYRYNRSVSFDVDSGFSLDQRSLKSGGSEQDQYFYLSAGYRMEF